VTKIPHLGCKKSVNFKQVFHDDRLAFLDQRFRSACRSTGSLTVNTIVSGSELDSKAWRNFVTSFSDPTGLSIASP